MRKYRRKNTRAKRVTFALAVILCILIIIAVAFYVFGGKKQSDRDEKANTDAAEFIVPDMTNQSDDEKTEETGTQTGIENTANVKSTKNKKQTDSKNSSTNQSKKKNTTEQSETVTPVNPDKNGNSNESNNTGNNTSGDDNQGNNNSNNNSSGREKNELEIIPSE